MITLELLMNYLAGFNDPANTKVFRTAEEAAGEQGPFLSLDITMAILEDALDVHNNPEEDLSFLDDHDDEQDLLDFDDQDETLDEPFIEDKIGE